MLILACLFFHLFMVIGAYFAGCWAMHCGRTSTNPLPKVANPFKRAEPAPNGEPEAPRHPRAGIPSRVGN